ncbi:hypothetical protein ASD04_09750 [Devosia sp. Root436]|uniref:hypothetical protein n=1 Tax=Devosia sp. Root436 TaxID=1736537 RepID=UPI0006FF57A4|nr:hypothetical protein [Devosia sp. Root436]KQX38920.1 hypothetical protein ASD04_09750 [Devosia sp. Root436]
MNALQKVLGGAVLAVVLAAGLAAPAMAQKLDNKKNPPPVTTAVTGDIDFGDDSSQWSNDGECDDPRFEGAGSAAELVDADIRKDATDCRTAFEAGTVALAGGATTPVAADIDFGDNSSQWSNDGECDDPRFEGAGSAAELVDADILKDANDCRAALEAGTVTFKQGGTTPADVTIATAIDAIDFGDDSSEWNNDGECDDPRFEGTGSAAETIDADLRKDATDCRAAYAAGTVTLKDAGAATTTTAAIDFGDNSSEWANDGECDDPRFQGTGSAAELVDADILKDATDCQAAYDAGTVSFVGGSATADIAYGDDTSQWSKDGECDDPRFSGTGVAGELLDADLGHDATDCRAAVEAGTATYNGESPTTPVAAFDYGSDWSKWANDGECDDLRFMGEGTDKKLLTDDLYGDATDCKALEAEGRVTIRKVYSPEYAAGAPYDSSHIEFGDNSSDYANDDRCDDPRFEGPNAASVLLESDEYHDSVDCKAAYEAGTIILTSEAGL